MLAAINFVKDKVTYLGKAVSTFGVTKESLRCKVSGMLKLSKDKPYLNKLGYHQTMLSSEEEFDLVS